MNEHEQRIRDTLHAIRSVAPETSDRIAEVLTAALSAARAEGLEEAAKVAEREMEARRKTAAVLDEVRSERVRQDARWGEQNHPDFDPVLLGRPGGCAPERMAEEYGVLSESQAKRFCEAAFSSGHGTYAHILTEEVAEVIGTCNGTKTDLRTELIQVAAVAVAWVEKLDREAAVLARAGGLCDACGWEEWKHQPRVLNVVGQELCAGFVAPRGES